MKVGSWGEGSAVRVRGWMVCVVVVIVVAAEETTTEVFGE